MGKNNRYLSLMMAIFGSIGVVAAVTLAAYKTPEAVNKVKADSRTNHDGDPYAYTKAEAIKSAWKYYVGPAAISVATISCIWGLHASATTNQLNLSSAYLLISEARKKLIKDRVDICNASESPTDCEVPEDQTLFYDLVSARYFNSTLYEVRDAEYCINREFALEAQCTLNDFYHFLGIPQTETGNLKGWSLLGGMEFGDYLWLDFNHDMVYTYDGLRCCIVSPATPPVEDFEYW